MVGGEHEACKLNPIDACIRGSPNRRLAGAYVYSEKSLFYAPRDEKIINLLGS
jgi:hypothetical protein